MYEEEDEGDDDEERDPEERDDDEERDPEERDEDFDDDFADPGGKSSLRAASESNPRNLPCPQCEKPNRLTPADRRHGYRCDECADRTERGEDY